LIIGGTAAASYRRVAEHADGWIAPGGGPDEAKKSIASVAEEWEERGRDGEPRVLALAYFSLGPDGQANADSYLRDYYAWLGDETAGMIADSAAKDADTVKSYVSAYEEAGCDELILFPSASDPEQVELLAEAADLSGVASQ
jgi:alkanesulfonate monooxygenase SsuD/methylene tetrahydromethanopterin reductase-like flavin-dependent oxidoreductase (luciferase family)